MSNQSRTRSILLFLGCTLVFASCVSITPEEQARLDAEYELNSLCSEVTDSFNEVLEKGKDLLRYDDALENYESTGLYGDTGFNANAPSNFFRAYEDANIEVSSFLSSLTGPTMLLQSPLNDLKKIVANPGATVSPMGDIYTSKWNKRVFEMNRLSDVLNALCENDNTIRDGAIYTKSEKCDLSCQFRSESEVKDVLVPSDSKGKKNELGFWKFRTNVGSVSDVSKHYLSTLSEKGWKFQSEESRLDPISESDDDEYLIAQVWCRTSPKYLNLLLIVSDLAKEPGTTLISLGTDTDRSSECK
jgi:hypothetical protein